MSEEALVLHNYVLENNLLQWDEVKSVDSFSEPGDEKQLEKRLYVRKRLVKVTPSDSRLNELYDLVARRQREEQEAHERQQRDAVAEREFERQRALRAEVLRTEEIRRRRIQQSQQQLSGATTAKNLCKFFFTCFNCCGQGDMWEENGLS